MVPGANAVVDILRDFDAADRDTYGDEVETGSTATATGVVMAINEQVQRQPVDGDLRTVSGVVGRAEPNVDVRVGDRLRDTRGAVYSVSAVVRPQLGFNQQPYVRMDLTRTT